MTLQTHYCTFLKSDTSGDVRCVSIWHSYISNHFQEISFFHIGHCVASCGQIYFPIVAGEWMKFFSQPHFFQILMGFIVVICLLYNVKEYAKYIVHDIFFSMCITLRLCCNKLSFQYGKVKKILFFFHPTLTFVSTTSCAVFFLFSVHTSLSPHSNNTSPCHLAQQAHHPILVYHQKLFSSFSIYDL
jgi:hypothetical protein